MHGSQHCFSVAMPRQKRLADAAGEPLLQNNSADHTHDSSQAYRTSSASRRRRSQAEDHSGSEYDPSASDSDLSLLTSDDQVLEDGSDDLLDDDSDNVISSDDDVMDLSGEWDDADDDLYGQRRARWDEKQRAERAERSQSRQASTSDVEFEGGYKLPLSIYEKLFDYQQTGMHSVSAHDTAGCKPSTNANFARRTAAAAAAAHMLCCDRFGCIDALSLQLHLLSG